MLTWIVKQLFQVFSGLCQRSRENRDQNVVQTLKVRQNLNKFLERKAELVARGGKLAQQRLYEAEEDAEVKHWEKRNSDIALLEINQEFESPTITTTTSESMR